jgi:cation-transporting P-type ATPase D
VLLLLLLLLLLLQVGLDGFYSTSRANRCVVCGQEQHYLRYRVVPACYR